MKKKEFNIDEYFSKQLGGMTVITITFLLAMAFIKLLAWSGLLGAYFFYTS